jgi:hypothetical protein
MEDEKVEPTNGDAIVANGQKDGDDVDAGTPAKRKRGRPPKAKSADDDEPAPKKPASGRGRGRPPKFPKATAADGSTSADANGDGNGDAGASAANAPKRKRGRPPKNSPASEITLAASATDATSAADTANVDQNAAWLQDRLFLVERMRWSDLSLISSSPQIGILLSDSILLLQSIPLFALIVFSFPSTFFFAFSLKKISFARNTKSLILIEPVCFAGWLHWLCTHTWPLIHFFSEFHDFVSLWNTEHALESHSLNFFTIFFGGILDSKKISKSNEASTLPTKKALKQARSIIKIKF